VVTVTYVPIYTTLRCVCYVVHGCCYARLRYTVTHATVGYRCRLVTVLFYSCYSYYVLPFTGLRLLRYDFAVRLITVRLPVTPVVTRYVVTAVPTLGSRYYVGFTRLHGSTFTPPPHTHGLPVPVTTRVAPTLVTVGWIVVTHVAVTRYVTDYRFGCVGWLLLPFTVVTLLIVTALRYGCYVYGYVTLFTPHVYVARLVTRLRLPRCYVYVYTTHVYHFVRTFAFWLPVRSRVHTLPADFTGCWLRCTFTTDLRLLVRYRSFAAVPVYTPFTFLHVAVTFYRYATVPHAFD